MLKSVPEAAPGNSLSRNTLHVLLSSGVSQVAAAVAYLLVARSTGPDDFGRAVAAVSLVLSVAGVIDFGTSTMVTRDMAARRMTAREALNGILSRTLVMLGVTLLLLAVFAVLGKIDGQPVVLMVLMALAMTVSAGLQGVVRGLGRIRASALIGATDKCVGLGVVGWTLLFNGHASGQTLLLALTCGPIVVSLFMSAWLLHGRTLRRPTVVHPYRGAISFGLTSSVTSVQTLDTSVIAALAGPVAAGQFGAVSRWVAPFNLLIGAFTAAAFPALAADPTTRHAVTRLRGGLWILGLSWAGAVLTAILSPWIVGLLLGPGYEHSAPVLALMALATIPASISQITLTLLQARGDEKHAARRIVWGVLAQLALVSLGSLLGGGIGAGAAILLTQAGLAAVLLTQARQLLKRETRVDPNQDQA